MKLTNCYRYMAVLYTASCGAASPLYGPLETGLQESQLLNSLKTCKSLEGPETDAYLSRTGLNGAYKMVSFRSSVRGNISTTRPSRPFAGGVPRATGKSLK